MANEFKVRKGLIVQGSGSTGDNTILDVQGNQGQLFSITDSLVGDIFTVSDISGIPILNVSSSGVVEAGTFDRDWETFKIGIPEMSDTEYITY